MKVFTDVSSWNRYIRDGEVGVERCLIKSKHLNYPDMLWKGDYEYELETVDSTLLPKHYAIFRYSDAIFMDKELTLPVPVSHLNRAPTSTILWD